MHDRFTDNQFIKNLLNCYGDLIFCKHCILVIYNFHNNKLVISLYGIGMFLLTFNLSSHLVIVVNLLYKLLDIENYSFCSVI